MPLQATFLGAPAFAALQAERPPLIIDPWLAAGSITLLFGPPSAGKTHLTISLARAIAHGEALWGMFPTQKSRVLVVQADMNTVLYQERVKPNADALGDDVAVLATDGMPFDITAIKPSDPVVGAVNTFDPAIIFVDTLRKSHMFDENDSNAADKVYSAWRALFPRAAFVFLHHSRKIPLDSKDMATAVREAFRGSGAWAASADTIIMQKRVRRANNPDWMTRLYFVRTRSCQEPASVLLKLDEQALLLQPLAETTLEKALLAWIAANPRATKADALAWMQADLDADGKPICSRATAYRAWDRLVKGER